MSTSFWLYGQGDGKALESMMPSPVPTKINSTPSSVLAGLGMHPVHGHSPRTLDSHRLARVFMFITPTPELAGRATACLKPENNPAIWTVGLPGGQGGEHTVLAHVPLAGHRSIFLAIVNYRFPQVFA
jgi:hypothetical protein